LSYHNAYRFCDLVSRSVFSDDLSLHTLELPKVRKEDEHTDLWAWLEFLQMENKEELEMLAKEYPVVQPAVRKLLRLSADEEARLIHEAREKARRDELSWRVEALEEGLAKGLAKGRTEGLAEGRTEGLAEGKQEVARKLLELGRPVEEIVMVTGLSREAVLARGVGRKARGKEEREMLAKEYPVAPPAVRKLLRLSADEEARLIHEAREKARRNELSWRVEALEEGLAKGLAKGVEIGGGKMQQKIARNLLERGMPVGEIMAITGLSREAILALPEED
jgi:flagellar biosynthesis/type III secretory pathway protein FliH